jgi:hypothetical protein
MPGLHKLANGFPAAKAIWLLLGMLAWLLAILLAWPWIVPPAQAAQSYDNCNGFIDSLPATISMQGVWCLRHDLATNITSGNAIEIAANNVTIDCNDFKLGGLAAGDLSQAYGIYAGDRQNSTVRHCNVRGFHVGILLGGAGHLVEDNRLDNNLVTGIGVYGDHNLVQHNRVFDTGGLSPDVIQEDINAIIASADIIDNTIDGVASDPAMALGVTGIWALGADGLVKGNRVGGLLDNGAQAYGIYVSGSNQSIVDNHVTAAVAATVGTGFGGPGIDSAICTSNTSMKFATTGFGGCIDNGGNTSL